MPILLIPSGHAAPVAAGFPAVAAEVMFDGQSWADVAPYCDFSGGARIIITRGSTRIESPVIRYDAGACRIPLNNADRRFDPTNLAGPYVAGGKTQVVPMVPVRVSATYASVTYRLSTCTADSWAISYSPPSDSVASVQCTDGFKQLGKQIRAGRSTYHGPGEDSGARVNRILDDAGWPASKRSVTAGDATLQATLLGFNAASVTANFQPGGGGSGTNLPDYLTQTNQQAGSEAVPRITQIAQPTGTPLDELQLVADTEMGELFINGNGFLVFRHRSGLFLDARSVTSQATFGDDPAVPTTELPYADVTILYDHATVYTAATIANVGGVLQTAIDQVRSQPFPVGSGLIPFDSENLIADTDFQALGYAQWVVATSAQPEQRFSELVIDPRAQPADLFPQVLGREIGDRITVKRRPPGGGAVITRDVFIRGIRHEFNDSEWLTTWTLQDATSAPQPAIWDSSNWDSSIWGF
jgi:hypothetical protein